MTPERTLLFVPGDAPDELAASIDSGADAVILDLEDTVGPTRKDRAREETLEAVETWSDDDPTLFVRINGLDTARGVGDLEAILDADGAPEAVFVPDVRERTEVEIVAGAVADAGADVGVVPIVERPDALFAVDEIARVPGVYALAFGSVDFRMNAGISVLDSDADVSIPRYLVSMAASAADVYAFDTVYLDRDDEAGLVAETRRAKAVGFDGKMAIHPDQIEPIAEAFAPSEAELERARRVIETFEATEEGVVYVDGTFVDKPVVDEQRALLERGRESGD